MVPSASNGATTLVEFPGKSFEPVRSSSYSGQTPRKLRQVHVVSSDGEAKFWLAPEIELARNSHEIVFSSPVGEKSL